MHGLILIKQTKKQVYYIIVNYFCYGDCRLSHCLVLDSLLHQITSYFSHYLKCLSANPISIPCIFCSQEGCKVVFMDKEATMMLRVFFFSDPLSFFQFSGDKHIQSDWISQYKR